MSGATIQFTLKADTAQGVAALEKMRTSMKDLNAATETTSKAGQTAFGGLMDTFGKLGALLTGGIVARQIYEIGKSCVTMAVNAVESENLFEVSMGKMAGAARSWSQEVSKSLGLNQYALRESIGTFNVMLSSMGLTTQQAFDMSKSLVVLANDMASFYNITPEEAFDRLRGGITGMAESLKRMGIVVDEAMVKDYAYKNHIAETGKELTNTQKIMARYGTIMEQTGKAQGDLARTIDSPANAMRVFGTRLDELKITLGNQFLPILSKVIGVLNDWAKNTDVEGSLRRLREALVPATAALVTFFAVWKGGTIVSAVQSLTLFRGTLDTLATANDVRKWLGFGEAVKFVGTAVTSLQFAFIAAGVAWGALKLAEWIASFRDAQKQADLADSALRQQADALEKKARSYNIGAKEMAYGIDLLHRTGWEDPKKYIDRIQPMVDAYEKLHTIITKGNQTSAASAAELTAEQKKLREEWEKQVRPMSAISGEFQKLIPLGVSLDKYVAVHWEDIIKATEAQQGFGESLNGLDGELYLSATIWKKADDAIKAWLDSLKNVKDETKADTVSDIAATINRNIEEISKTFAKSPDIWKMVKLPTDAEIDRNWAEFNRAMVGNAGETRDAVSNEISTIFDDWIKGMADSIVEWKGFWSTIAAIAKDSAKGFLRIFFDELFSPLKVQMKNLGKTVADWLSGILGRSKGTATSGGATAGAFGDILGSINNDTGKSTDSSWISKVGSAITGLFKGKSVSNVDHGPSGLDNWTVDPNWIPGGNTTSGGGTGAWGKGGVGSSLVGGAMTMVGTGLFMDSFKRGSGLRAWGESVGGGALAGAGIGTMILPGIGTAIGAAVGAIAGAVKQGIQSLVIAIKGKNSYQAGAGEVGRDFGGISADDASLKAFADQVGISEDKLYNMRKDFLSSPKALTDYLGPLAMAQGKTSEFLDSLSHVTTAWGTFDFRKQYELGELTGDWSALDDAYKAAFKDSAALNQSMPDWQNKLLILGDTTKKTAADFQDLYKGFKDTGTISDEFVTFMNKNADALDLAAKSSSTFADELTTIRGAMDIKPLLDGLKTLKDGIASLATPVQTMYDKFFQSGEMTDEFAAKITGLGGDLSKFTDLAGLIKINTYFGEMVQHFKDTGEILPDLITLYEKWGGSMEAMNAAAALPGLHKSLDFITSLKTELQNLVPADNPVAKILAGNFDQSVIDALTGAGLDPEKFKKVGAFSAESNWDQMASDFKSTGKLTDPMKQALLQYGGEAGQTAVSRYGQGFNTISDNLLAQTKAAMDVAYQTEIKGLLGDLADAETKTTSEITTLTTAVTDQFTIVGNKIADAITAAANAVVAEIDVMIGVINHGTTTPATPGGGDTVPVGGDTSVNPDNGGKGDLPPITVNINGDVYGNADFDSRVAQAITTAWRNGGFAYMRSS